jgi:hypothetical protein
MASHWFLCDIQHGWPKFRWFLNVWHVSHLWLLRHHPNNSSVSFSTTDSTFVDFEMYDTWLLACRLVTLMGSSARLVQIFSIFKCMTSVATAIPHCWFLGYFQHDFLNLPSVWNVNHFWLLRCHQTDTYLILSGWGWGCLVSSSHSQFNTHLLPTARVTTNHFSHHTHTLTPPPQFHTDTDLPSPSPFCFLWMLRDYEYMTLMNATMPPRWMLRDFFIWHWWMQQCHPAECYGTFLWLLLLILEVSSDTVDLRYPAIDDACVIIGTTVCII